MCVCVCVCVCVYVYLIMQSQMIPIAQYPVYKYRIFTNGRITIMHISVSL